MKNRLTTFAALSLMLGSLAGLVPGVSSLHAQTRHVFLEEFTGTWCGWCPRGVWAIQQLEQKYPDQVIVVSIHNGDPMTTPEGNTLQAGVSGLQSGTQVTGFPNGWANRLAFASGATRTWNTDPGSWSNQQNTGLLDTLVNRPASAQVSLSAITFDPTTRALSVTVSAKFLQDLSGDYRFNLYLTEDSVTGGSAYDQHNYLTNRAGYEDNPFYNLPPVVPGYHHNHVVRAILPSAWGTAGIVPATVHAGETYSQTFTYTVPANIHPEYTHLIGMIHQYSTTDINAGQVLDAAQAQLTTLPALPAPVVVAADGAYITTPRGTATNEKITLKNNSNVAVTTDLALTAANSTIPSGWQVTVTPSTLTIPANGTADATVTYTTTANAGFAHANISILPSAAGHVSSSSTTDLYALAAGTRIAMYGSESVMLTNMPDSLKADWAVLPLTQEVLDAYPTKKFDIVVFANDPAIDYAIGSLNGAPPPVMSQIQDLLAAGKRIFISSNQSAQWGFSPNYSGVGTSDLTDFFNTTLGLDYVSADPRYNTSSGASKSYPLQASTDPISSGLNLTNAGGYPIETVGFSLADGSQSIPLYYFDNSKAKIAGVRWQDATNGAKVVYLGFALTGSTPIANTGKLFKNAMDWLAANAPSAVDQPKDAQAGMSAVPNPFQGQTQIRYTASANEGAVTFTAVNLLGQEIAKLPAQNLGNGTYSASFDASNLANGTYVIVAHSSTGAHQIRVVNQQ